jgi:flagella basal body P-ring formation protein FlgA
VEPRAVLTFRAAAEVRDRVIRLGDVANIEGADEDLVRTLEAIEVGAAPATGRSRQVSAQYVKIRIRMVGLELKGLLFDGPLLTSVTRPEQVLAGAQLQEAACRAVEEASPGATARVGFTPQDLRLPMGTVELKPQGPRIFNETSGTVVILVLVDGIQEAQVTVSFRIVRKAPTVVAARDLLVGTLIAAEDVVVEERAVMPGPLVLSDVSLAVGQQASVPIKGGTPLTSSMVKPALVVRRGARVKLVCKAPTFTVTTTGEALQDATAGQLVRVKNTGSALEVIGLAIAPQTVEVSF